MDQSDSSVGVDYISIFGHARRVCRYGYQQLQLKRIWILVETRVNRDGYFVVLTYPS